MKRLLAGVMMISGFAVAAPAMAQGVYIGPGGVGVDSGLGYGRGYRSDRYRDRDYRDDRRGDYYEGRSVSRGHRRDNYFYDHY